MRESGTQSVKSGALHQARDPFSWDPFFLQSEYLRKGIRRGWVCSDRSDI